MLAIAGGKGGSGKTTTAAGVAAALARRGHDPVLVDCDTDMPDLHQLLDTLVPGGLDRLAAGDCLESACQHPSALPGVRCVTGGDRDSLTDAFVPLFDWHGPVVLDCPPGTGPDAVEPVRHAACTVLVSTDHPPAITDTVTTARAARAVETEILGAVIRETRAESAVDWPDRSPVLTRVRSVAEPLDSPQVRTDWGRVAGELAASPSVAGPRTPPDI